MMATFMLMMVPRAAVSRGPHRRGAATPSRPWSPPRGRSPPAPMPGTSSCAPSRSATRRRGAGAVRRQPRRRRPGRTTAIIGSTGAGKTTLLSLIPRLFDVVDGEVLVDGVDVRDVGAGRAPAADRDRAAAALPVLGDRGQQPPLRQPRRDRRRAVAVPRDRAGARLRRPRCPRVSTRRSPRAARTCPAASASGSRSRGRSCASRRSTCSTTRSRRSISAPTRGCGPRCVRWSPTPP